MSGFEDRQDAGRQLGALLLRYQGPDLVVVGLPRGGVPVAAEVANILGAPLDVILVRKLGVPSSPETAMGAIAESGIRYLNPEIVRRAHVNAEMIAEVEAAELRALAAREHAFRQGHSRIPLVDKIVIVVDDGVATGATARVACRAARMLGARRVILATPVAAADSLDKITEADEIVCAETPSPFVAVGLHYLNFVQTSDAEVIAALETAKLRGDA